MESFEKLFFSLFFLMLSVCGLLYCKDNIDSLISKENIDKYVFEHDCNVALNENWVCYLDGDIVDLKGIDLSSRFYVVNFDYYDKIVIVTRKYPDRSNPTVIFTK